MPARNVFLRIMLWSLGLAAVGGVLTVLTQSGDIAWRVVGTCVVTAVACGLMIPISRLVDRKQTRPAGLFGMGAVVVEFILALLLIWDVPRQVFHWNVEGEIIGTMLLGLLACILVLSLLQLAREPYGMWAGRAGVVLTLASFISMLVGIWLPRRLGMYQNRNNWWETGFAVAVLGALSVMCLVGHGVADPRRWRFVGVVAGAIACCMWLVDIWIGSGSDPGFIIFCGMLCFATVVGHANLSVRVIIAPSHTWVRTCTLLVTAITAVMIEIIVMQDRHFLMLVDTGLMWRLTAAGGIVTGCGTMALVVFARFDRRVDLEGVTADLSRISVVCPRCRKKQMIGVGDSVCAGCDLRISIRLEEPRCPKCDYLLFGLTSDRCPECGTPIKGGATRATAS